MVSIDPASGGIATSACPRVQKLPFLDGTEPTHLCPLHSGANMASAASTPPPGTPLIRRVAVACRRHRRLRPMPQAATNNVFGAVGHFFGSLFH